MQKASIGRSTRRYAQGYGEDDWNGATVGADSKIGAGTTIGAKSVIGEGVVVHEGAYLNPDVIVEDGVNIGKNSLVDQAAKIEYAAEIEDGSYVGAKRTVESKTVNWRFKFPHFWRIPLPPWRIIFPLRNRAELSANRGDV